MRPNSEKISQRHKELELAAAGVAAAAEEEGEEERQLTDKVTQFFFFFFFLQKPCLFLFPSNWQGNVSYVHR